MAIRILTVPFDPEKEIFQDEDLSRFLLNKRVMALHPQFFLSEGRPFWTVFVEYEPILDEVETRPSGEELSDIQRTMLDRLRAWRKEKAGQDGVPVFILATNAQLEQVARRVPTTMEALRQIHGFGKKKVDRHGQDLIELVKAFHTKEKPSPPTKSETVDDEPLVSNPPATTLDQ